MGDDYCNPNSIQLVPADDVGCSDTNDFGLPFLVKVSITLWSNYSKMTNGDGVRAVQTSWGIEVDNKVKGI